jgi:head-tail adaptor
MRKRAFVDVMRQRLSLDAASESSDESGALQTTWVAQGHLWGQIIPASSGERFLADRQEETVTHRIR